MKITKKIAVTKIVTKFLSVFAVILMASLPFASNAATTETELLQLKLADLPPEAMPGYMYDIDQVFKINSGPLKGKIIFFALSDPESEAGEKVLPKFVVTEDKHIVDQKTVPTVELAWNITSVHAMAVTELQDPLRPVRILAILDIEPAAGGAEGAWLQPFVFDLASGGVIKENVEINKRLALVKPAPKSIRDLKKYLLENPKILADELAAKPAPKVKSAPKKKQSSTSKTS